MVVKLPRFNVSYCVSWATVMEKVLLRITSWWCPAYYCEYDRCWVTLAAMIWN